MSSINTNSASMAGLRILNMTQKSLSNVQDQLASGLKVNGATDAPATFVIAQGMRGDIKALAAVKEAIDFGSATNGMAVAGATSISNQLTELKGLATQAKNGGLDGAVLQAQVTQVLAQIDTISSTSSFNGVNLLTSTATTLTVPTGLASTDKIDITNVDLSSASGLSLGAIDVSTAAGADTALTAIAAAQTTVGNALVAFGNAGSRLESQGEFTTLLSDTMKEGLGTLVDADMADVAANLQALQTKEQLNIQALSIANSAPQSILALFR